MCRSECVEILLTEAKYIYFSPNIVSPIIVHSDRCWTPGVSTDTIAIDLDELSVDIRYPFIFLLTTTLQRLKMDTEHTRMPDIGLLGKVF